MVAQELTVLYEIDKAVLLGITLIVSFYGVLQNLLTFLLKKRKVRDSMRM